MNEAEFARCQSALGRRIHENDGVFWEEVYPFYCKPAFNYKPFDPGVKKPASWRSLLGYSHQVRDANLGNRTVPFMVLDSEDLRSFDIMRIPIKKRPKIRKGLKACDVHFMEDLVPILDRVRQINIKQAVRQEKGAGAETPVKRYTVEADAWRAQVLKEFSVGGREWWGAFIGEELAAYMRTYQVDGVRVIEQTKVDNAYYKFYPMDALYYTIISQAAADQNCQFIVNGRPQHSSLNYYKEQFCFKSVEFPYYSTNARMVEFVKKRILRIGVQLESNA